MNRPFIFLDKDGTLIDNVPHNVDPALVTLATGADGALARLHDAGFGLAIITNQSGVALGRFKEEALEGVERRLRELLEQCGVPLAGFYACPHHPQGVVARYAVECRCRKPAPGLIERAAGEVGADLHRSWMIGDILDDVEAGHRAGCRTVLVDNGGETEWRITADRVPDLVVPDIATAAHTLVERSRMWERATLEAPWHQQPHQQPHRLPHQTSRRRPPVA